MQTPMAAIEESVDITNRFLLLSGTATLLIGMVLVLALSRSFTRPIRALSRVAGSVARLDFSDRYTGKRHDELDDLGNSINAMSQALETTIGQLRADNERKTQESEARKAFIANVSHELKTPIALIQTYAEGLREGLAEDKEMRDSYCQVIEEEAQNMSDMIRRMTTLMQLQTGDGSLSPAPFDLAALARELLFRNAPLFRERRLNVEGPPETPVWVTGDASLIENVISNFLSNALHHTPEGGRVTVSLSPVPLRELLTVGIQFRPAHTRGRASPDLGDVLQGRQSPHTGLWGQRHRPVRGSGRDAGPPHALRGAEPPRRGGIHL